MHLLPLYALRPYAGLHQQEQSHPWPSFRLDYCIERSLLSTLKINFMNIQRALDVLFYLFIYSEESPSGPWIGYWRNYTPDLWECADLTFLVSGEWLVVLGVKGMHRDTRISPEQLISQWHM